MLKWDRESRCTVDKLFKLTLTPRTHEHKLNIKKTAGETRIKTHFIQAEREELLNC